MPPGAVKVDRSTHWGNPFVTDAPGAPMSRRRAVELHRAWLAGEGRDEMRFGKRVLSRPWVLAHLGDLAGRPLACWCRAEVPCHADTLIEMAAIRARPDSTIAKESA
jgi:hypothetical protein